MSICGVSCKPVWAGRSSEPCQPRGADVYPRAVGESPSSPRIMTAEPREVEGGSLCRQRAQVSHFYWGTVSTQTASLPEVAGKESFSHTEHTSGVF